MTVLETTEIDLLASFRKLWRKKFILFIALLCSIILCSLYIYIKPAPFKFSINIFPVNQNEISNYASFNDHLRRYRGPIATEENQPAYVDPVEERISPDYVTSNFLLGQFVDTLNESDILFRNVKEFNFIDRSQYDSEFDFDFAAQREAHRFMIKPIEYEQAQIIDPATANRNVIGLLIEFTHFDRTDAIAALESIITAAQEKTRTNIIQYYENFREPRVLSIVTSLDNLQSQIDYQNLVYHSSISEVIDDLNYHALIARELGVNQSTISDVDVARTFSGSNPNDFANLDFTYGEQVLNALIAKLEDKLSSNDDSPEAGVLRTRQRLLQDEVEFLQSFTPLIMSPLGDEETFQAVSYSLASVEIKRTRDNFYLLLVSALSGLFFSSLIVLIKEG